MVEGDEVQDALFDVSGSRTVPQVFIGGQFVGGGDGKCTYHQFQYLQACPACMFVF